MVTSIAAPLEAYKLRTDGRTQRKKAIPRITSVRVILVRWWAAMMNWKTIFDIC